MKTILFMAMTTNGMIAREDGSEDFLSDRNWKEFCALAKKIGCFVVGRKTYELVQSTYENYNFDDVEADRIVVSANTEFHPPGVLVARSPGEAIRKAASKGHRTLLLTGGSYLNSSFAKSGLINEIIIDIEPAIVGKGIRIFAEENFYRKLKLIKTRNLTGDILQVHYKVVN